MIINEPFPYTFICSTNSRWFSTIILLLRFEQYFYLFLDRRSNVQFPLLQHNIVRLHLQSPRLFFSLESDETITFGDPGSVLNDLGLFDVSKCWEERVKLRLSGGGADASHKHSEKYFRNYFWLIIQKIFCWPNSGSCCVCKMWYKLSILFVFLFPFETCQHCSQHCTLVVFILNWK